MNWALCELSSLCTCEELQTRKLAHGEILAEQSNPGDLPGLLFPVPRSCGGCLIEAFGPGTFRGSRDPAPEKEYWGGKFSNSTSGSSNLSHRIFHTSRLSSEQSLFQHLLGRHTAAEVCETQARGEWPSMFGDLVPRYLWILKSSDAQVSCIKRQCLQRIHLHPLVRDLQVT